MYFILPKGTYYDASGFVGKKNPPSYYVADESIECAERPEDYVLTDNWKDNPMDVNVCWRPKTTAELSSEEDTQKRALFTEREDTTLLLFFELTNMVRVLEGKSKITKQQFWDAVKDRHKNQQFFDF